MTKESQKTRKGRPTSFDVLLDLAQAMWAPVFRELTDEDMARLNGLKYDDAIYADPKNPYPEVLASYQVARATPLDAKNLVWPSPEQVYTIHDELIRAFGGTFGVLRPGTIEAVLDAAQHSQIGPFDRFPTAFEKAAYMMREIINGHPFADGQKRTGLATAFVFLGLNGYALWARHQLDEVHFAIEIAKGEHDIERISQWLRSRVGALEIGKGNPDLVKLLSRGPKKIAPSCFNCRRPVKVYGYRAICEHCYIAYELTARSGFIIPKASGPSLPSQRGDGRRFNADVDMSYFETTSRAVGIAEGPKGRNFEARVGLHKLGEGKEAVEKVRHPSREVFRMYDAEIDRLQKSNLPIPPIVTIEYQGLRFQFQVGKTFYPKGRPRSADPR